MAAPSCSGRTTSLFQSSLAPSGVRAWRCGPSAPRSRAAFVRAAGSDGKVSDVKPEVPMLNSKDIGPIPYPIDNESFTDVMAFKGPAPERINGRVAMWAFLICSLQEVTGGQSVAQQALAHPVSAFLLGVTISVASLAPKYVAGVPLEELQDAASRDGLPEKLRFFNRTHEIWLGRVAMVGFLGLIAVETVFGRALFAR